MPTARDGYRPWIVIAGALATMVGLVVGTAHTAVAAASTPVNGSWSALGTGTSGTVSTLVLGDDTLYAGGSFTTAGGVAGTNNVAAWSFRDDTWSALGTGTSNNVQALAVRDDTLYAGGSFTLASGVPGTDGVAAWSLRDDTWSALGTGAPNVAALVLRDDTLYAGGAFARASGVETNDVAAWSLRDDTWSALGTGGIPGRSGQVFALAERDGTLFAGGNFTIDDDDSTRNVATWSPGDATWSALGVDPDLAVVALAVHGDMLYVGGGFTTAGGVPGTNRVASWSVADDTWSALGTGTGGTVRALAVDDGRGLVYSGGNFTTTDGGVANALNRVGVWDPRLQEWIPFQWNVASTNNGVGDAVRTLVVDDSVVYVGGSFTDAGGIGAADRIARWSWAPPSGSGSFTAVPGDSVTVSGASFIGVDDTGVTIGGIPATIDFAASTSTSFVVQVPAGVSGSNLPITMNAVGGTAQVATLSTSATPPAPAPVFPPSAPASVTGVAGDGSAVITWAAPTSSGSFPVSTYQAVVLPGGRTCLVAAQASTCTISGLTNGTTYTATVRALNGAGWGPYSTASAAFTPEPPVTPSITLTGTRAEVRGRPGVVVTGTTTGFGMGAILRPWTRFPGQASYTQGTASILVDVQGGFTWERRTGKTIYILIRSEDATVESNRLILRAT